MACLSPISVSAKKGKPKKGKGKKCLFSAHGFTFHLVPCGKCAKCLQRRVNEWAFRLDQERKVHNSACFATLTYASENLPYSPGGLPSLRREDLTKFLKRLRRQTGLKTIRYYACGEYGDGNDRPHYHLIIFDVNEAEIQKAWSIDGVLIGLTHVGEFNTDTCAYCAKYCSKEKRIPRFSGDDREPEYSVMSKGLGLNYLTPQMVRWHQEGQRSFVVLPGGFQQALPRYYRDRIFSEAERDEMNVLGISGNCEKLIRKFEEHGYSRSLPDDHPDNQIAKDYYYHARAEGVKAANAAYFRRNKRKKV